MDFYVFFFLFFHPLYLDIIINMDFYHLLLLLFYIEIFLLSSSFIIFWIWFSWLLYSFCRVCNWLFNELNFLLKEFNESFIILFNFESFSFDNIKIELFDCFFEIVCYVIWVYYLFWYMVIGYWAQSPFISYDIYNHNY